MLTNIGSLQYKMQQGKGRAEPARSFALAWRVQRSDVGSRSRLRIAGADALRVASSKGKGRFALKRRVLGSLAAAAGLTAVLMATASGAGAVSAHAAASKKIVVGVSLAGYSTGFWAAYVQYEKGFAKTDGLTLDGPVSAGARRQRRPRTSRP